MQGVDKNLEEYNTLLEKISDKNLASDENVELFLEPDSHNMTSRKTLPRAQSLSWQHFGIILCSTIFSMFLSIDTSNDFNKSNNT